MAREHVLRANRLQHRRRDSSRVRAGGLVVAILGAEADASAGKDLADWARVAGLQIGQPPVFPVNSVKVMRGAFVALEHDRLVPYARAAFRRYWGGLEDISQDDVVAAIVADAALDADEFFAKITSQPYKDKLRANTDELIERGYLPDDYPSVGLQRRRWVSADGTHAGRTLWTNPGTAAFSNWAILWRSLRTAAMRAPS